VDLDETEFADFFVSALEPTIGRSLLYYDSDAGITTLHIDCNECARRLVIDTHPGSQLRKPLGDDGYASDDLNNPPVFTRRATAEKVQLIRYSRHVNSRSRQSLRPNMMTYALRSRLQREHNANQSPFIDLWVNDGHLCFTFSELFKPKTALLMDLDETEFADLSVPPLEQLHVFLSSGEKAGHILQPAMTADAESLNTIQHT